MNKMEWKQKCSLSLAYAPRGTQEAKQFLYYFIDHMISICDFQYQAQTFQIN